jgi:methylated-DNA-[protein]-cysteine S-methyltransferase
LSEIIGLYYSEPATLGVFEYVIVDNELIAIKLPTEDIDTFHKRIKSKITRLVEDRSQLLLTKISQEIGEYLNGSLKNFTVPYNLEFFGTTFQQKVWKSLLNIPYGTTTTYRSLAEIIGTRAVRAVGSALGRNPIPIIVPCHRVLASSGLGGYSGGLALKEYLLNIESGKKQKAISAFFD